MLPGEDELEEVVSEVADDEAADEEDLLDFDDEVPAGEGAFADESDGYKGVKKPSVALAPAQATDVKALLSQVRKSKKKPAR
ncbi:MAG: hypothetical protein SFW67_23720 [Myxococcaceae bacterium]|nr:hypothetical protein [Myxococcaceae bacterium]